MTEQTTTSPVTDGGAGGGKGKPTAGEILAALNRKVNDLVERDKVRELDIKALQRELSETKDQVERLSGALFVALSMHLDLVTPLRSSEDPAVAEEAESHSQLALASQASIKPDTYEKLYGLDAQTGAVLPGRTPGVPLED